MNAARRKEIAAVIAKLEHLGSELEAIANEAQQIADDERDAFDSLPEGIQDGDKGQAIEAAADSLENAASELSGFDVASIVQELEDACA